MPPRVVIQLWWSHGPIPNATTPNPVINWDRVERLRENAIALAHAIAGNRTNKALLAFQQDFTQYQVDQDKRTRDDITSREIMFDRVAGFPAEYNNKIYKVINLRDVIAII